MLEGFGGVSEYGITVRWDKNFLTLIHLTDSPKGAVDFIKKIFHSEVEIPKQKPKRKVNQTDNGLF